jgi:hypothetical protein
MKTGKETVKKRFSYSGYNKYRKQKNVPLLPLKNLHHAGIGVLIMVLSVHGKRKIYVGFHIAGNTASALFFC